jgi:hypothetical protein
MKFALFAMATLLGLCFTVLAFGQATVPVPVEGDFAGILGAVFSAFGSGQWVIGSAFIVMLLTAVLDKTFLKNYVPTSVLPWISIGLAIVYSVLISIGIEGVPWWKAILVGLTVGPAASGLYSLVGKHFLPSGQR